MRGLLPKARLARACLALSALLVCAAPPGMRWLRLDNGIEQWVVSDAEAARYTAFQRDFGGEDFLLLAYTGGPLFDEDALDLQLAVLEAVESLPAVHAVQSLPSLFRDHFGAESGEELAAEIASSPFYNDVIVSHDRAMAGMMIGSTSTFSATERRDYVAAIRDAAQPLRDAGWTTYVVGPSAVNAALDVASEAESRRLLPVAVVASTVLLLLLLRSIRQVAAVALVAALTQAVTLGLMGWLGLTVNMVTVALPPVLWVLSAAYAVHLLRYYDRALAEGLAPAAAREQALAWAARPNLLAATTTATGFLALLSAVMAPVRDLGIAAAMGVPVAVVVTFGVGGLLLQWVPARTRIVERGTTEGDFSQKAMSPPLAGKHLLSILESFAMAGTQPRLAKPILALAGIGTALCIALAARVSVESNPLTFLDANTPIVRDSAAVAERFTGLYTLETVLDLPDSWLNPEHWPAIEAQTASLAAARGVARVLSPLDYLKKLNQWSEGGEPSAYRLPEDRATAEALLDDIPEEERGPLRALVSTDGNSVRLSSLVRVMDGGALLDIVGASEAALARSGMEGYPHGRRACGSCARSLPWWKPN